MTIRPAHLTLELAPRPADVRPLDHAQGGDGVASGGDGRRPRLPGQPEEGRDGRQLGPDAPQRPRQAPPLGDATGLGGRGVGREGAEQVRRDAQVGVVRRLRELRRARASAREEQDDAAVPAAHVERHAGRPAVPGHRQRPCPVARGLVRVGEERGQVPPRARPVGGAAPAPQVAREAGPGRLGGRRRRGRVFQPREGVTLRVPRGPVGAVAVVAAGRWTEGPVALVAKPHVDTHNAEGALAG